MKIKKYLRKSSKMRGEGEGGSKRKKSHRNILPKLRFFCSFNKCKRTRRSETSGKSTWKEISLLLTYLFKFAVYYFAVKLCAQVLFFCFRWLQTNHKNCTTNNALKLFGSILVIYIFIPAAILFSPSKAIKWHANSLETQKSVYIWEWKKSLFYNQWIQ